MNDSQHFAWRLLRFFCPSSLLEEIEGDLREHYEHDVRQQGRPKADRNLVWNVFRYLRPGILMRFSIQQNQPSMLRHYFQFYFRSAARNRQAALTSLAGLIVGLSGAWLMGLFVDHETRYENLATSPSTYRIVFGESDESGSAATPHVLATELSNRYPGVTPIRFTNAGGARINFYRGDNRFMESTFYFADPGATTYFPFGLVQGDGATCLSSPFTMVITRRAAMKFFGEEEPVGKTISMDWIDKSYEITITGLIDEERNLSHISFDYLISMATAERLFRPQTYFTDWTANFSIDYVHIENPEVATLINSQLTNLYHDHQIQTTSGAKLRLQPVTRIHLYSHLSRELGKNGDIKYVYLAACIGIMLLLVTLINYINVLSALFVVRMKEIGIRKSLGAAGLGIFRQFLVESLTHMSLAAMLSVIVVVFVWPLFAQWAGLPVDLGALFSTISLWLLAALIMTGVVSAIHPALLVARQPAGRVLYGIASIGNSGSWTRQALVTFQVFIALIILCGSMVVRKQMEFIREHDLGYKPGLLVSIPQGRVIRFRSEQIKNELMQTGQVASATISSTIPSRSLNIRVAAKTPDGNPEGTPVSLVSIDYDFFDSYGLAVVHGRPFSPMYPSDSISSLVINESAARAFGWSSPLGKEMTMSYNAGDGTVETRTGRVIGVVKDFNFESLHKQIEPIVFFCKPFWYYYLTLRLKPGETERVLAPIKEKWTSLVPDVPFEYEFITERIDHLYTDESKWGTGINFFSVIAIIVSSLGLVGLISFYLQTRMKELAMRKVLGAGVWSLSLRVYSRIMKLFVLAAIPAIPIAWWLGEQWVTGFAYRTTIDPSVFVSSILILMTISTTAVAVHIVRAATVNPIVILKST